MVYHHWSKLLLVEFTPYVLMIVLNCLIWRRVRTMVRMRYDVGLAAGETEMGGGGSPRENKKPNLKFANVFFFSVSMESHSRTPKSCFILGLECLGHF